MSTPLNPEDPDYPQMLVFNHHQVSDLQFAVINAPRDANILRSSLRMVLEHKYWNARIDPRTGALFEFGPEQFLDFVTAPLPRGLDTTVDIIRRFIQDDPGLLADFDVAIAPGKGAPKGNTNWVKAEEEETNDSNGIICLEEPKPRATNQGNTAAYAHRRLTKAADAGDAVAKEALDKVRSGEMSPHRAMVDCGFRKVPTPLEAAQKAFTKLTKQDRVFFLDWVNQQGA